MKRTKVAALLAAVAMAAVGCTSADEVGDRREAPVGPPMPKGAAEVSDLPAPGTDKSCGEPTASLRPDGPPPPPGDFATNTAMQRIHARGKLIVGVDQNTYQFGYRDPSTGQLQGFDIDMAKEIAKAIFGDPEAIQFKVLTSAQRVPAVKNGDVDLVVETMTINCERREDVEFSSVYYLAGQRVLVKEKSGFDGIRSLAGKKVCAAKGSTSIARIVNVDTDPRPVGIGVDGWTDCLVMLQQNQVDAVSTDDTILAGLRAQDPFTEVVGEPLANEPYGMAMSKESPEFTRFVNAVLEQLRTSGRWTQIYNLWLRDLLETPASPPPATYRP
ncbi:glutamate ABC transporter substrate-binding protein [Actinophytocola algeriensis]|uniref:Polar amino acid transport system substrate-binding protein n=1 Tax=Actinophytocola algeriensis TaxID=1768010 RepID=A0A7W7Q9B7_9PSEU|nr:glutamate ABC transporter substrate-binding protein [Actinophytocola algeriensis]MBB4909263.1 polar amino acid transport system substrate-binding protein [Actinophytocola algeriensis]MBE1474349.1 polar amino acid transport system substrate-binding protein [Actinophytocola algeriensis]